jgi:hypothetical protein
MGYKPLPVPLSYQGASGEPGQILLDGIVQKITLYHDRFDDEADWHVYIRPERADWPQDMYCEIMVLDDFETPFLGDDKFFTADFSRAFRLIKEGSVNPAWEVGLKAIDEQSDSVNVTEAGVTSRVVAHQGRAYLQGPYVNDEAHGTRVEIHPLDSIAFAIDDSDQTIAAKWGQPAWPETSVRWRVAYFANSSHHRINGEKYVKKERTTTWFLDLLRPNPLNVVSMGNVSITEIRRQLRFKDTNKMHDGRGFKSIAPHELVIDPKDGRRKLKVSSTMNKPDEKGGIVVIDYLVRFTPPVIGQ